MPRRVGHSKVLGEVQTQNLLIELRINSQAEVVFEVKKLPFPHQVHFVKYCVEEHPLQR